MSIKVHENLPAGRWGNYPQNSRLTYTYNNIKKTISYSGRTVPAACGIFNITKFTFAPKMTADEWEALAPHIKENIHRLRWSNYGYAWVTTNSKTNKYLAKILMEMQDQMSSYKKTNLHEIPLKPQKRKPKGYI